MNRWAQFRSFVAPLLLILAVAFSLRAQQEEEVRGAPAEPDDAAEVRAQITAVEKLLPTFADRGAALYFLAAAKQHLGESREALELLKQCLALDEGFDPSGGSEFLGLKAEHAFTEMVDRAHQHFPAVSHRTSGAGHRGKRFDSRRPGLGSEARSFLFEQPAP